MQPLLNKCLQTYETHENQIKLKKMTMKKKMDSNQTIDHQFSMATPAISNYINHRIVRL